MSTTISALRNGDKKVTVSGQITEAGKVRDAGGKRILDVTITDITGSIKLTLWEADVDRVHRGDTVLVSNGYVTAYKGTIQLNVGQYGTMEVTDHEEPSAKSTQSPAPKSDTGGRNRGGLYDDVKGLLEVNVADANKLLAEAPKYRLLAIKEKSRASTVADGPVIETEPVYVIGRVES